MKTTTPILNPNPQPARLPRLTFGYIWLIVLPAGLWGILDYYLPLLGGTLSRSGVWIVTMGILLLAAVSLVCPPRQ